MSTVLNQDLYPDPLSNLLLTGLFQDDQLHRDHMRMCMGSGPEDPEQHIEPLGKAAGAPEMLHNPAFSSRHPSHSILSLIP